MIIRAHAFNSMVLFSVFYTSACISRCCKHRKIIQLDSYLFSFNVYQCCLVYVHKSLDEKLVQMDPYVYICIMCICKKKKEVFRILSVEIYLL